MKQIIKVIETNISKLRIRMNYKFSSNSIKRMKGVHPDLITIFNRAIKNSPIDFGIPATGGLRTEDVQKRLFKNKTSKCDGVNNISNHQKGMALDFYAYVDGKASWDKVHLALVAGVIMATASQLKAVGRITHRVRWGGTFGSTKFKGWDMPHFEII